MTLITKENATKIVKSGVLAGLSCDPIANAIATFFNEFVNSNWQERIDKTQEELIKKISRMDSNFEKKIRERSNFSSILHTVYHGSLTDIDDSKISYYIDSLINAINNEHIDNTKIHIFLNFLKDFSLSHIKILQFFSSVKGSNRQIELNSFNIKSKDEVNAEIISDSIPELIKDVGLFNNIMNDLNTKGLLTVSKLSEIRTDSLKRPNGIYSKFTTSLGDEFLEFIREHDT